MATLCPTCQSAIDPARAPAARVRGGKVVTYCSVACADRGTLADPAPQPTPVAAKPVAAKPAAAKPAAAKPAAAKPAAPKPAVADAPASATPVDEERTERAMTGASSTRSSEDRDRFTTESGTEPGDRSHPRLATRRGFTAPRKLHIVVACSIALVCGMGIVAIEACPSSTDVRAAADPAANLSRVADLAEPAALSEPAQPQGIDPNQLLGEATTTLHDLMESPSPRLQRLAAMALARTGDATAMTRLHSLMQDSSSELVELQIAYALARAGDSAGRDHLIGALASRARDARLDGARYLAQLGDQSATTVLRNLLDYRSFRISAAGLLARLDDAKGIAALREAIDSKQSSNELRMRAEVELGRAGDSSVHDRLVAIQEGGQYQVGAALALATLEDRSVVPALGRLLTLDSFRVRAALGLRRLGETVELEPLAAALATGSDVTRVTAAEAILILLGPETVAEYD